MKTTELSYLKTDGKEISEKESQLISQAIIKSDVALKGEEVAFIRKSLKLSYDKFSKLLGVNASTVLRWEKNKSKGVSAPNSLAIRSACSSKMGIELKEQNFYTLKTPKSITLDKKSEKVSVEF